MDAEKKNYLNQEKQTKIVIEKSKFLSFCYMCDTLQKQSELLKEMQKKHPSATHVCYASIIEDNGLKMYANDDGEPSGTAGVPILNALKDCNLINTLCIVVRYFGGIKLGAANLGRTYRDSAYECLKNNFHEVVLKSFYEIVCEYTIFDRVKNILAKKDIEMLNVDYGVKVKFKAYLSEDEFKLLQSNDIQIEYLNEKKYC